MVGNVNGRHTYRKSPAERVREHREDPGRVTSGYDIDDLQLRYLSATKRGLWTEGTRYARGGLVGWFDFTEQRRNELNETRSPVLPRQSRGSSYHCADLIVGSMPDAIQFSTIPNDECRLPGWRDLFTGGRWTSMSPDRFPSSNWDDYTNSYYLQPDYASSTTDDRDPTDVHDSQAGLGDYTDPDPCSSQDISDCHCCLCPACGSVATRHRVSKTPDYACGNPSCSTTGFESPDVRPARRGD